MSEDQCTPNNFINGFSTKQLAMTLLAYWKRDGDIEITRVWLAGMAETFEGSRAELRRRAPIDGAEQR